HAHGEERTGPALHSVPGKTAELIEVDVPSAQDGDDLAPARRANEPVQQRRDRGGGGAFDDDLRACERPEQCLEDSFVGERDDVVDHAADDVERVLADALYPEAVDRAL